MGLRRTIAKAGTPRSPYWLLALAEEETVSLTHPPLLVDYAPFWFFTQAHVEFV